MRSAGNELMCTKHALVDDTKEKQGLPTYHTGLTITYAPKNATNQEGHDDGLDKHDKHAPSTTELLLDATAKQDTVLMQPRDAVAISCDANIQPQVDVDFRLRFVNQILWQTDHIENVIGGVGGVGQRETGFGIGADCISSRAAVDQVATPKNDSLSKRSKILLCG